MYNFKKNMRKFILLLFFTATLQNLFAQRHTLGLHLLVGQTYYHIIQSQSTVQQQINGQQNTVVITMAGKIAFNVTGIKDSVYEMSVRYQQLSFEIQSPDGSMSFSSEKNDSTDVMSKVLALIKDKSFFIIMTKEGRITEVKNLDTVFGEVLNKSFRLTTEQKQQIKAQLVKAFGEKSFKGSFEMVTAIYPHTAVEKGNSWIIETQLETGMEASLTTSFQYVEAADNYNIITGSGKIETADKDAYIQVNGMPVKYDLSGTMNSTIKVDNETGWVIESKINEKINGSAQIKDNPKLPGGLTIPMIFETKMIYSNN
jgi:hypothetical protein